MLQIYLIQLGSPPKTPPKYFGGVDLILKYYKDSQKNLKILFENSSIYNSVELSKKIRRFSISNQLGYAPF
jgi:hypothetical protein